MSSVSKPRVRQNRHKQGLNQTLEKISADFRYYNEIYPTRIDYTGNTAAGLQPYASVRLSYVDRPDTTLAFIHGHRLRHLKCVSSIGLYHAEAKVREYRMGYTLNHSHNLLTSVTEVSASGTEKNPTTFQWNAAGDLAFSGHGIQQFNNLYHVRLHVGDFNGDGRDDFVAVPEDGSSPYSGWQLYLSQGSSFYNASYGALADGNRPKVVVVADFNGDGLADMATVSKLNGSYDKISVYRSTGSGFSPPDYVCSYSSGFSIFPVEANGDGASELMVVRSNGSYYIYSSSTLTPGSYYLSGTGACSQTIGDVRTVDVNGDGLTDVLNLRSSSSTLMIANGQYGFTETPFGYGSSEVLYFGDFNADGKDDYLYSAHNGTGLTYWPLRVSSGLGTFFHSGYVPSPFDPTAFDVNVADVNGDGYADLLTVKKSGSGQIRAYLNDCSGGFLPQSAASTPYAAEKWRYYPGDFNGDGKTDYVCTADYEHATWRGSKLYTLPDATNMLLGSVTDGLGNTAEIGYKYMSDPAVHTRGTSFDDYTNSFSSSWPLVWQVRTPDGLGGQRTVTYAYSGALMHRKGRGVLGFSSVTATDDATGMATVTGYEPSAFKYVMDAVHTETRLGSRVLAETDTEYSTYYASTTPFRHHPTSVTERTYEYSSGALMSETTTTSQYDSYGNLTHSTTVGGGITVHTSNTYQNDAASWRLGRLTQSVVTKSTAEEVEVRQASFEYDQSTGLLSAEVSEPYSQSLGYRKTYVRDAFGNITSSTTAPLNTAYASRTDSTTYDAKGRFLLTQRNSLGHMSSNMIDDDTGLMYRSTDANGVSTSYSYDSFGRCRRVTTPLTATNTTTDWSAGNADAPATALYHTLTETTGQPYSLVFSDCLGRTVRTVTENAFGQKVYTDVVYNAKGQVWKTSEPYFPGSTPLWNVCTYDAAGRLLTQTDAAGGTTTYSYYGHETTVTDALGHSTTRETDSHGNLVRVTDHEGNTIEYLYDVDGRCIQLTGPRTTVTMEYDRRGNRTRLDDPDLGTVVSDYNAFGELVSQTDQKGTTTYTYDKLGRVTTETRPDVTVATVYDTRFIGAVTSVTASNGTSTQYHYDSYGRVTSQTETTGAVTLTVATAYNAQNLPASTAYPNGFTTDYGYSANGLLTSVSDHSTQTTIWQLTQQDARGNATQETLGNGLLTTNTYDAATGRLTAISTPGIQSWTYGYDAVGNLLQRTDMSRGMTEGFAYDTLGRLVEVSRNGQAVQLSAYDAAGNVLSRTGVGHEFTYAAGTNRLTGFYAETPYVRPWDNIQYTSFHKVSRIVNGSDELVLTYGPDKSRRKAVKNENGGTETKHYFGGLYEETTGAGGTVTVCYIFAGGRAVAIHETQGGTTRLLYLHHDHLGSITAYSDASGSLVQELGYDAWGRRRDPSTWQYFAADTDAQAVNPWGFSGHEHIDLFGMVNMDGRMYDPMTGRFLSPDPFVQAPDFTQGLNRYSYCLNNPLSLTDPTGYSWLGDNWKTLVASAVGIAVSAVTAGSGSGVGIAIIAGAAGGAAGALTGALLNGANLGQVAKATLTGAFWGAVSGALNYYSADPDLIAKVFKHTFSQGFLEGIQGGNAVHGIMMGAVSGAGGHFIDKYHDTLGRAGEIATNAVLGGTIDELGGGKFANGAITSAFSTMFNDMMHPQSENEEQKKQFVLESELSFDSYPHEKPLELVFPEFDILLAGRMIFTGVVDASFSLFSRSSYSSIEDMISKASFNKVLKHNEFQYTIKNANLDKVFNSLASRYNAQIYQKDGYKYFNTGTNRVGIYNSSSGVGKTIQINYNKGEQILKIRSAKNLK